MPKVVMSLRDDDEPVTSDESFQQSLVTWAQPNDELLEHALVVAGDIVGGGG